MVYEIQSHDKSNEVEDWVDKESVSKFVNKYVKQHLNIQN